MVTYEQAKKKALKENSNLDSVVEYKMAYVFSNSKAKGNDMEDNDVVIMKSSGNRISMSELVIELPEGDKAKKRAF